MSEFITNLQDLNEGDDVVVTITGIVAEPAVRLDQAVSIRTADGTLWFDRSALDCGAVSIERIQLKEKKELEPGAYQTPSGKIYVKSKDGQIWYHGSFHKRSVWTDEDLLEDLAVGRLRRLS